MHYLLVAQDATERALSTLSKEPLATCITETAHSEDQTIVHDDLPCGCPRVLQFCMLAALQRSMSGSRPLDGRRWYHDKMEIGATENLNKASLTEIRLLKQKVRHLSCPR
eukprot:1600004-Amphidinium_carterae.1